MLPVLGPNTGRFEKLKVYATMVICNLGHINPHKYSHSVLDLQILRTSEHHQVSHQSGVA